MLGSHADKTVRLETDKNKILSRDLVYVNPPLRAEGPLFCANLYIQIMIERPYMPLAFGPSSTSPSLSIQQSVNLLNLAALALTLFTRIRVQE